MMRHSPALLRTQMACALLGLMLGTLPAARAAPSARPERAASVGSPSQGHLVGGKQLGPAPCLRLVGQNRWGVPELVGMVERACAKVAAKHPGAVLTVGDLSRQGGGDVGGHNSHESGRDVDLGFYLVDKAGRPTHAARFATIQPDGRARGMPAVRFDDDANWALVEAVLRDSEARALQIFVADPLRARLIAFAARTGASASLRDRAARVMLQPHHALPHDNHFHVRIACPAGSRSCVNYATPARAPKARTRDGRGAHESRQTQASRLSPHHR